MKATKIDTIPAIATAPGYGGVGIIRVSGPETKNIAEKILRLEKNTPASPRTAHFSPFYSANNEVLDEGISLYFPGPNSFTGEDVLELQGHGGPVVLSLVLNEIIQLGARIAKPGEFSERAFLNDKMDLSQAEAVADLINSSSEAAAKSAVRSMQGAFSKLINEMVEEIIQLRIYVEAAIDFPEEEIDFLNDKKIYQDLERIMSKLDRIFAQAKQGALLKEGMTVVIAGEPNAGKSSLLNALSGKDSAIVTPIPGTTRDILKEHIQIDGLPLNIIDTAGLRKSTDQIEQEGIRRAYQAIEKADTILFLVDGSKNKNRQKNIESIWNTFWEEQKAELVNSTSSFNHRGFSNFIVVQNKIDITKEKAEIIEKKKNSKDPTVIKISAKTEEGMDLLKNHLKKIIGFDLGQEAGFISRQRHLDALKKAQKHLANGKKQLQKYAAGELLAEDLRLAQRDLGEITGEFTPDDLLGRIFSSFCIGK